jgi:hypothetical protein
MALGTAGSVDIDPICYRATQMSLPFEPVRANPATELSRIRSVPPLAKLGGEDMSSGLSIDRNSSFGAASLTMESA